MDIEYAINRTHLDFGNLPVTICSFRKKWFPIKDKQNADANKSFCVLVACKIPIGRDAAKIVANIFL
ncbi:hypothetical protein LPTSP3_g21060 [Leptospira kobayashii]|uniref:Uncharacterized protein n=1 Tax=Leptospira kobayashii TaxID=1917830 RepID=A0ABM7USL0_9LEPT|nr:hypothetical protein LPTSP3_g21060 [Leptospira kobayashii]